MTPVLSLPSFTGNRNNIDIFLYNRRAPLEWSPSMPYKPHNGVEMCYKSTNWFGRFEDIGRQTQWHFYANCHITTIFQLFSCSPNWSGVVALYSVTVRVLAYKVAASNLGKLFRHVPLPSSSIIWYRSHDGDAYGWEGNRRYSVALAMHNGLKWFIRLYTGASKEDEYTPHVLTSLQRWPSV